MKPIILSTLTAALVLAQQQAAPAKPASEEKKAAAETAQAAQSPDPAPERNFTFSVETGYRFLGKVGGDFNTYRSLVNLGEGPKLLGLETMIVDPSRKLFDRFSAQAHSWGGDPYNTARVDVERRNAYRLVVDYRNMAYFNFLPSFANPSLERGVLLNQRSYDAERRYTDVELDLLPGRLITPFFNFTANGGRGRGITPFVAEGNEYPVATLLDDGTNLYSGGVRIEARRFHVTLEQGGATYHDDQKIFTADRNTGNRLTPLFNQQLFLRNLDQTYRLTGDSIISRGILTASPTSWMNTSATFVHSRPKSTMRYTDNAQGLFYLGVTRFYTGLQSLLSSEARLPRNSASLGVELRPHRRVRITEALWIDRFHTAGSANLAEQLLFATGPAQAVNLFQAQRLVLNQQRQQMDAFVDIGSRLTVRGGHRYVWGNAASPASQLNPTGLPVPGEIRMHVALAGATFRASSRALANIDYEGSPGDRNYFRTSLHDYDQVRARVRYQVAPSLQFSAAATFLDNRNPTAGIQYSLKSRTGSGAVQWLPRGGKRFSLLGEYAYTGLRSDIGYFSPGSMDRERSLYQDYGHVVSALLDVRPAGTRRGAPWITAGGTFFTSCGSRPTDYYQPIARAVLPVAGAIEAFGEWRYFGLSQTLFRIEGFRGHQGVIGLRLLR